MAYFFLIFLKKEIRFRNCAILYTYFQDFYLYFYLINSQGMISNLFINESVIIIDKPHAHAVFFHVLHYLATGNCINLLYILITYSCLNIMQKILFD